MTLPLVLLALLAGACAHRTEIPASLEKDVDNALTFAQLNDTPEQFIGRMVRLGGEVLSAKRLPQETRIEILQLPLTRGHGPGTDRMASEGRFLAVQEEFMDPAIVPAGSRVTIIGEVTGTRTLPLDETDYTYLTLAIKHLKIWPEVQADTYYYGPYVGPYPWRPYWPRYPYWW